MCSSVVSFKCFILSSLYPSYFQAEVWKSFLCKYTCVQCLRLYKELPAAGFDAIHQCCDTLQGMIVELEQETFKDFVLRSSMSHIPLEAGPLAAWTEVRGQEEDDSTASSTPRPSTSALGSPDLSFESNRHVTSARASSEEELCPIIAAAMAQQEVVDLTNFSDGSTQEKRRKRSKNKKSATETTPDSGPPKPTKRHVDSDEDSNCECWDITSDRISKTPQKKLKTTHSRLVPQKDTQQSGILQKIETMNLQSLTNPDVSNSPPSSEVTVNRDLLPESECPSHGRRHDLGASSSAASKRRPDNEGPSWRASQEAGAATSCVPYEHARSDKAKFLESNSVPWKHTSGPSACTSSATQQENTRRSPRLSKSAPANDGMPRNLDQMHHIIFVDLDNWGCMFKRLPMPLPAKTFVWGFYGGKVTWREPIG